MAKRKQHGPGMWLCWACANEVTNHPDWEHHMWIGLPKGYRSKGGPCAACGRLVRPGEKCAKVTVDAPIPVRL